MKIKKAQILCFFILMSFKIACMHNDSCQTSWTDAELQDLFDFLDSILEQEQNTSDPNTTQAPKLSSPENSVKNTQENNQQQEAAESTKNLEHQESLPKSSHKACTKERKFVCPECNKKLSTEYNLQNHIAGQHTLKHEELQLLYTFVDQPITCLCGEICNNQEQFEQHLSEKHIDANGKYTCKDKNNQCLITNNFSHIERFIRTRTQVKPYKCNKCNRTCSLKGDIKQHVITCSRESQAEKVPEKQSKNRKLDS